MSEHEEQARKDETPDVEGHRHFLNEEGQDPKSGEEDDTPDVEGHLKKGHARMAENTMRG